MNERGQALIEFAFSSVVVVVVLVATASLLKSEWKRTQCIHLAFEETHAKLVGRPHVSQDISMRFEESVETVRGIGTCGNRVEVVELPKLEAALWK
jgi:hypothetical protein